MSNKDINTIKENVPASWTSSMDSFIVKGKNAEIWDKENNRYIDYVGGYAVLNTGHLNPRVVKRVEDQLKNYSHSCFAFAPHENAVKVAKEINDRYPIKENTKTFLVNSGAESIENATKIARYFTKRKNIIAFKGGFHGRTYLTMGLTGKDNPYKTGFGPFPEFIHHAEYPYLYRDVSDEVAIDSVNKLLENNVNPDDVAAFVVEVQLGEGGYIPASKQFLAELRRISNEKGILLIFDEVQTGFGRTGEMFGADTVNVSPDIATLAKGIAGGFPLAAVVGKSNIMDSIHESGIGSTFGASPISCAAALGVLEVFDKDNLIKNTKQQAEIMNKSLKGLMEESPFIGDVRGYGTMIGVEIVENQETKIPAKDIALNIIDNCKTNGLLLVNCGLEGNVIRFMGPLTTPINQVEEALEIFKNSVINI